MKKIWMAFLFCVIMATIVHPKFSVFGLNFNLASTEFIIVLGIVLIISLLIGEKK